MGAGFKVVEVALKLGISGFTAPLGTAVSKTQQGARQMSAAVQDSSQAIAKAATDGSGHLEKVGKASALMGGAMLAGFGVAVHASMGFEAELSNLQAASSATSDEMSRLRQQALDAGAATSFSAGEAAQAQTELAKAGVSTADILGGALEGSLSLAAAGQLDLAESATISANAMTVFGLKGRDVGHIADVLAAAANKSAADVDDIAQALNQTGLVADQFGLTLEDTAGVLAMFAQAGLKGSDAGTSMKTMLQRLIPQSDEAAATMKELGLDFFDAQGDFVGIDDAAGQLHDSLGKLTAEQRANAMQTIFGSDAIRAATILYEQGEDGVDKWASAVNDAGFANEMAGQKMNNLAGDIEGLQGSIETVLIQGGSKATGALRGLTQGATDLVNGFGALPSSVQTAAVAIAGVGGAGLTTLGVIANIAPKVAEAKKALESMGTAGQFMSRHLGTAATAVGAAGVALTIFAKNAGDAQAKASELIGELTKDVDPTDMDTVNEALVQVSAQLETSREKVGDYANAWGIVRGTTAMIGNAFGVMDNKLYEHAATVDQAREAEGQLMEIQSRHAGTVAMLSSIFGTSTDEVKEWLEAVDYDPSDTSRSTAELAAEIEGVRNAAENGTPATDKLSDSLTTAADSAASATEKIDAYKDALDALIGVHLSAFEAETQFGQSIDDLNAELDEGKLVMDANSEAGRNNRAALADAAQAAIDHSVAVGQESGSTQAANLVLAGHVGQLRSVMHQAGMTDSQIDLMIATMGLTPENIRTLIQMQGTDTAERELGSVQRQLDRLPNQKTVHVKVVATGQDQIDIMEAKLLGNARGGIVQFARGGIQRFAGGGESHIAQFAKPGAMRLWAEPETGGEAYIPLANDWRRPRAVGVLDETARRFGLRVTPASVSGVTYAFDVNVSVPVSASMTAMDMARLEDAATRATRHALSQAMAGVA